MKNESQFVTGLMVVMFLNTKPKETIRSYIKQFYSIDNGKELLIDILKSIKNHPEAITDLDKGKLIIKYCKRKIRWSNILKRDKGLTHSEKIDLIADVAYIGAKAAAGYTALLIGWAIYTWLYIA